MDVMILSKLHKPRPKRGYVRRPRLLEKLNTALESRVFLVTGPAGFGKSSLLSNWLETIDLPYAWVDLESSENNPVQFWKYVATSLQKIAPELGKGFLHSLSQSRDVPFSRLILPLLNDISQLSEDVVLVLDDFHLIVSKEVEESLTYMLQHLPYQCHVIISSRGEISLPLARLRVLGELVEIGSEDLRFTAEEVDIFFQSSMNISLDKQSIQQLRSRTEGWVTGLQLAGLALKGHKKEVHQSFIQEFSGRNRFVLDYLMEEVLNGQPLEIQDFLKKVSILDRMNASLCNWVTDRNDSQETLESLVRNDMFLFSMDESQEWFRFHHLFKELLNHRIKGDPDYNLLILHKKALEWFESQGDFSQAIHHAFLAEDYEKAANLVISVADDLVSRSETASITEWLAIFPKAFLEKRGNLLLQLAWVANQQGDSIKLKELCMKVTNLLESQPDTNLEGRLHCILSWHFWSKRELDQAETFGQKALDLLENQQSIYNMMALASMSLIYLGKGMLDQANALAMKSYALAHSQKSTFYQIHMSSLSLGITLLRGQFDECRSMLNKAYAILKQDDGNDYLKLPAYGVLKISEAELLQEEGRSEEAVECLMEGINLGRQGALYPAVGRALVNLAFLAIEKGETQTAQAYFEEATLLFGDNDMLMLTRLFYWRILFYLKLGDFDRVRDIVNRIDMESGSPVERTMFKEIQALFLLQSGRIEEAIALLKSCLKQLELWDIKKPCIRIRRHLIRSLLLAKKQDEALSLFIETLRKGKALGFFNSMLPLDESLAEVVLQDGTVDDELKNYVVKLIKSKTDIIETRSVSKELKSLPWSYRMDPLSKREIQVLNEIANGLTNQEIADELYISLNTVRTHTKNINSKLNVNSRGKAVATAREFGLIA